MGGGGGEAPASHNVSIRLSLGGGGGKPIKCPLCLSSVWRKPHSPQPLCPVLPSPPRRRRQVLLPSPTPSYPVPHSPFSLYPIPRWACSHSFPDAFPGRISHNSPLLDSYNYEWCLVLSGWQIPSPFLDLMTYLYSINK